MILKGALVLVAAISPILAFADLSNVTILEASSSGKTVRINLDASAGLQEGEPILFRQGRRKIATGRVLKINDNNSVITILEQYGEKLERGSEWEMLHGEPFDNADNLPDYIADREDVPENPANEKFFTPDGREIYAAADLDDENYTPETTVRPRYPRPPTYLPHNITLGTSLFRNRALPTADDPTLDRTHYTTYSGFTIRYAYTFQTYLWLRDNARSLISAEVSVGTYSFDHTFPDGATGSVNVLPIGFNLRYLIETSKMLRIYPYLGYQYNLIGATGGWGEGNEFMGGSRLIGGGGAQLVMSDSIDARLEAGSDGVSFGIVVKLE